MVTDKHISDALVSLTGLSNKVAEMNRVTQITGMSNDFKTDTIQKHKKLFILVSTYFNNRREAGKNSVSTMTEILNRRKHRRSELDENGDIKQYPKIHLGLDFIHKQFNNDKLFPLGTFMSLIAGSGVGKSDILYMMTNSLLMQNYKVMLCSFEFGEDRLANIAASREEEGSDKLREAREAGKFDNLFINYYSRDIDALETLIDIAHTNGVQAIFIDSFGEVERGIMGEYSLQQNYAMMLNSKVNDYGIFICTIAQTNSEENEGEYRVRGGTDLLYKPDLAIYIKKLSQEDTSGDRVVHLFKNRDADLNGKTIITEWNNDTRKIEFKANKENMLSNGKSAGKLKFGHSNR